MVWDNKVKKLKGILVLVLLLALLASPVAVLASDISGAKFYGLIQVSNNGTAITNEVTTCNISTENLIAGGYLNSTANNCAIQSSAGADLAFMPALTSANASYPWCLWVPSMGADSIKTDILYTAESTGGKIRYFPAAGGMTTVDNDVSLELGDNFTVEQKGWVDTTYTAGDVKLLVDKPFAFGTGITDTEEITSLIQGDAWIQVAPRPGVEENLLSLAVFDGELYGGTYPNGKLYEWNGSNAWVEVAPKLAETIIYSLAVFNDKLYGGTSANGKLYEWNGSNAWVEVAPKLGAETTIYSLVVFNDKLYGGTGANGKLYEWNGSNLWVEVAPKLAETEIRSLAVYNGKLYGGTGANGKLYEWNGSNLWVEVAPQLAETTIYSLAVFDGKLYGGTGANGKLYEWNGSNAWVEVAPKLGAEDFIYSLLVYNGKLYGGTGTNGKLYEWNGSNLWVEVAPQLAEPNIYSLATYSGKLYGGTGAVSNLYEWDAVSVTAAGVSSGEYAVKTEGRPITDNITSEGTPHGAFATAELFDDNYATYDQVAGAVCQFGMEFVQEYAVYNYTLTGRTGVQANSPKNWTWEGSDDGTSWTIEDTQTGIAGWLDSTPKSFSFTPSTSYRYWRINTTVNNGGEYTALSEIEMSSYAFWIEVDNVFKDGVTDIPTVPNTGDNWTFCLNNVIPYLEYQDIEIDGVECQRIVWEYDTTFYDTSGFDNDATPTFRTSSSDPDVSAELVSFLPVSEAKAPAYVLEEAVPFIEEVPPIVSEFDTTPPAGTFPLAGVIVAVASATDTPPQLPLVLIAGFTIIGLSLAISSIMRRYGSGTILVKVIVIAGIMGVFVAIGNFGIDFWMIVVFLIIGIALSMASRQLGWQ